MAIFEKCSVTTPEGVVGKHGASDSSCSVAFFPVFSREKGTAPDNACSFKGVSTWVPVSSSPVLAKEIDDTSDAEVTDPALLRATFSSGTKCCLGGPASRHERGAIGYFGYFVRCPCTALGDGPNTSVFQSNVRAIRAAVGFVRFVVHEAGW